MGLPDLAVRFLLQSINCKTKEDVFLRKTRQVSESIGLGMILAVAGGFLDAYSYVCRGQVFSNAQTGNILLVGVNVSEGNWGSALRYLVPVIAFTFGIVVADMVRYQMKDQKMIHWRQITVLFEIISMCAISFMPQEWNLLANSLASFACGIQVESFRKINGNGMATTMCIGNLRTATQHVCEYQHTKDKAMLKKGILFYAIILFFAMGAIIGNLCVTIWKERAIFGCAVILIGAFLLMFIDGEKEDE